MLPTLFKESFLLLPPNEIWVFPGDTTLAISFSSAGSCFSNILWTLDPQQFWTGIRASCLFHIKTCELIQKTHHVIGSFLSLCFVFFPLLIVILIVTPKSLLIGKSGKLSCSLASLLFQPCAQRYLFQTKVVRCSTQVCISQGFPDKQSQ